MSRSRDIADFVAEITDGTDTVATGYVINGSAKAWIDHSNTAVVNDSFNVSSLTDHGTGNHEPNLTNNFSAANSYAVSAQAMDTSVGNGFGVHTSIYTNGKGAGSWRHSQYSWAGAWQDTNMYALAVGDLA